MLYKLRMIGTYLSGVDATDENGKRGSVMITEDWHIRVIVSADSLLEAYDKAVADARNCYSVEKLDVVEGSMAISPNADLYATPEQIEVVRKRLGHFKKPDYWVLTNKSLRGDKFNQAMEAVSN